MFAPSWLRTATGCPPTSMAMPATRRRQAARRRTQLCPPRDAHARRLPPVRSGLGDAGGRPHPGWTGGGSLKARNTRRDPRVALSIVDVTNPYVEAQLRGRVGERRPDPAFVVKDQTARKYTGKPFPWRNPDGVTLVIEVDRVKFARLPFVHAPGGRTR